MKNSNQLKALIRNYSKESSVSAQILLRNYMHERFLERVSLVFGKQDLHSSEAEKYRGRRAAIF